MVLSELKIGQIVRVIAGRDAGRFMLIVGFEGSEYVLLADGKRRRLLAPKKKKYRHIAKTNAVIEMPEGFTDRAVVSALMKYNANNLEREDCEQE